MRRCRGFTLIELMVAIAIIAVLAAIAFPSYSDYVRRGRVTDAVSALSGMRVKMEQYFQDNRTYVGACATGTVAPKPDPTQSFDFNCPTLAANQYTIEAVGKGSMQGYKYTINELNVRTSVMTAPSTWPGSTSCWVLKKDGSC